MSSMGLLTDRNHISMCLYAFTDTWLAGIKHEAMIRNGAIDRAKPQVNVLIRI